MKKYFILIFLLSGCSTYPTKFKCGDAKGLGCTMMHEIDQQIDSGKITEIYKKCCSKKPDLLNLRKKDF